MLDCLKKVKLDRGAKHLPKPDRMSSYQHYVLSTILPEAEQEYIHLQKKNQALEKENEALKKKVEFLMTGTEQFNGERQRIHNVVKNRGQLKKQAMLCKNELSVLGKKIGIQKMDLKRQCKQNEDLKQELESVKKDRQSAKQTAAKQRAWQEKLTRPTKPEVLADIKKLHHTVKQQNRAAKRNKKPALSSGDKQSQNTKLQLKTGDKLKQSLLLQRSSEVQVQSELRIVGTKM